MSRVAFAVSAPTVDALRAINYSPFAERIRLSLKGASTPLGDLCSFGTSYGSVFTRQDCAPEAGISLLAQSDMFATEPACRIIRKDSLPRPAAHYVHDGQILIAGAGQMGEATLFGRAILADARLSGKYLGPDVLALTPVAKENDYALYLYAYLASRTGLALLRSTAYGTSIPRLRIDLLRNLPVVLPPSELVSRVAACVRLAQAKRAAAKELRDEARRHICGTTAYLDAEQMLKGSRRRAVRWSGPLTTLRAWNVASTGGALEHLQHSWSGRLHDVLKPEGLFQGPRFARVACNVPFGIDLLSQRDVFMIRRIPRRIARPSVPDSELFTTDDALLLACDGQLSQGTLFGRVELSATVERSTAISEHILRVIPKAGYLGVAYAFLSSEVGHRLLQGTAVGTSIPKMRLDLVSHLPYPDLPSSVRTAIEGLIRQSAVLRCEADFEERAAANLVDSEVIEPWLS